MRIRRLLPVSLIAAPLLLAGAAALAQPSASLLEPESQLQDTPKRRDDAIAPMAPQVTEPLSNMVTGVSIDRYIGDVAQSPTRRWRNTMFVQNILRSGDPDTTRPGNPGAVLKVNRSMDLATLPARNVTPLVAASDQFILYVQSGQGRLDDGSLYWDLRPGIAVLVPAGAMHRFTATGDAPLKMLVLTQGDAVPPTAPRRDMLVRDTLLMGMSEENAHWSNMSKVVFGAADGMAGGGRILLVFMGPMTIAGPHAHVVGTEEMWVKVTNGAALMQIGSEIRPWRQNMGMLAPPNGRTVHAAINTSNQIQHWLYFGAFPPNPNPAPPQAGRGGAGRGANPPPSFPQAAAQRATVAGRPLSTLPADAYRW